MADQRLRDLERRFRETQAREDEVAWLNERRRVGLVDERVLQAVAALGHPAAVEVTGGRPIECHAPPPPWWTLSRWRSRRPVIDVVASLLELLNAHGVALPGVDQLTARTALAISSHRGTHSEADYFRRVAAFLAIQPPAPGSGGPLPPVDARASSVVREIAAAFGRLVQARAEALDHLSREDLAAAAPGAKVVQAARRDILALLRRHAGTQDADEASALMATVRADLGAWLLEHRPEAVSPGAGDQPCTPGPHGA